MKYFTNLVIYSTTFLLLSTIITGTILLFDKNNEEHNVKCQVLKTYETSKVHKYHVNQELILILKDENGRIFSSNVTPETHYLAELNKTITLKLTERDITGKYSDIGEVLEKLCLASIIMLAVCLFLMIGILILE